MAASAGDGSNEAGGPFIDSSRLDLRRYARRPSLAMVLADYLIFVERNPRKVCVLLPCDAACHVVDTRLLWAFSTLQGRVAEILCCETEVYGSTHEMPLRRNVKALAGSDV